MIGLSLRRVVTGAGKQVRLQSTFNKYPILKVKPMGISGNAILGLGTAFLAVAVFVVQKSGYLVPHTVGPGLSPVGRIEIDLSEEALKKRYRAMKEAANE